MFSVTYILGSLSIFFKGLLFITNPFTSLGQKYWIYRCLRDYPKKPHRLNLDAHGDLGRDEDWWEVCVNGGERGKRIMEKLRWITLGYHHNWDTKVYSEDARDPFPEDLVLLSQYVAGIVGFREFTAEAAIVNFYHMDSTLSGHTDHSEMNKEAPLLSFSFGQKAVFLIGGRTKEEKPTALFIRSGDIVIMSGSSRLCYHGIPRIMLSEDSSPWQMNNDELTFIESSKVQDNHGNNVKCSENDVSKCERVERCDKCLDTPTDRQHKLQELCCDCKVKNETRTKLVFSASSDLYRNFVQSYVTDKNFWQPFENYIRTSRINLNVRQVLFPGQKFMEV